MTPPKPAGTDSLPLRLLMLVPGIAFLALILWFGSDRFLHARNDFSVFWAGPQLLGTSGLYDAQTHRDFQIKTMGVWIVGGTYFPRLPFWALFLKPLALMSYLHAYAVFQFLSLACFAIFVKLYARRAPELLLYSSLSIPLVTVFAQGQDVNFVLLMAAISLALLSKDLDFPAGLILSLCLVKFHLFVLTPVALLRYRRWKVIGGATLGSAILLALSFAVAGPHWVGQYLNVIRDPQLSPSPNNMPNINGLLFAFGITSGALEVAADVAAAVLAILAIWRSASVAQAFAYALIGGVLASHHCYLPDCTLLLLSFAILASPEAPKAVRVLNAFATLPPVYLMMWLDKPFGAAAPAALVSVLVAAAVSATHVPHDSSRIVKSTPRPVDSTVCDIA